VNVVDLILPGSHRLPVELGAQPYDDVLDAIQKAEAAGHRPRRLAADDWVTLQDIAWRAGCSREIVRLWSAGQQGPGTFPPPLNPDCETRFFSWAEAGRWLKRHTRHDPGPMAEPVLAAMNLALQLRRLAPYVSRLDAVKETIFGGREV
jgi:hypothetical protein